jgi:hypothetical protein
MEVADRVAMVIDKWRPDAVFVDQTGVGAGVVDRLQQLGHDVIGVDSASAALTATPRMVNRRVDMWWQLAEWLKHGCVPDDGELLAELTAPTFKFDSSGRLVLESKADLKKRGLPSPDKADALALTFAAPVQPRPAIDVPGANRNFAHGHDYDPFAG